MNIFNNLNKTQEERDKERIEYYRQKRIQQYKMQNIYDAFLKTKKKGEGRNSSSLP